jgi:hypothetical protein
MEGSDRALLPRICLGLRKPRNALVRIAGFHVRSEYKAGELHIQNSDVRLAACGRRCPVLNMRHIVRFKLTAASMKMTVFWDVASYSLAKIDRHCRGAYCLHHQGDVKRRSISETKRRSIPEDCHLHHARTSLF